MSSDRLSWALTRPPEGGAVFLRGVMQDVHRWYALFAVDVAYGVCRMSLQRDFTLLIEEILAMARPADFSDDDRQLLVAALDLAIASCERRAARKGESPAVVLELQKQGARYAALKGSVLMTK